MAIASVSSQTDDALFLCCWSSELREVLTGVPDINGKAAR